MRLIRCIFVLFLLPVITEAVDIKPRGAAMDQDNPAADMLLEQADSTFQARDYQAALEQYTDAYDQARKEFNPSVEVEAASQIARMNLLLEHADVGRQWLDTAAQRATDSDPMGWSRYLGVKGRFEWKDNELKTARETFDRMYNYCTTNALWGRAIDAAHMVAIVAESSGDQIEWGKRGIEAAEKTDNEQWLGPLWNNLAGTYYDLKQYDSALTCYLKAREYHWRFSGEYAKLFADYHVGMTYRLLGNLDEAGKWLRPVLAWAERIDNHGAIGQACEDLGEIEIARGNKPGGLKLLERARSEYKKEGYDRNWPEIWSNINGRIADLGGK